MPALVQVAALVMVASSAAVDGLELERRELSRALTEWRAILRGLCAALVLVPIGTVLVARGLGLGGPLAIGLVVLSVCPGAPSSPRHAKKVGGSFALATVLNAAFGVLTALTAAPSARELLKYSGPLDIHPLSLVAELSFVQLLPLGIGLAVLARWPRLAARARGALQVLSVAATVAVVALAILPHLPTVAAIGWTGVWATMVTTALALALGALMGDTREGSRTLAGLAAVPNVGLAEVLVTSAGASSGVVAAVAGIFLVRLLVNAVLRGAHALRFGATPASRCSSSA